MFYLGTSKNRGINGSSFFSRLLIITKHCTVYYAAEPYRPICLYFAFLKSAINIKNITTLRFNYTIRTSFVFLNDKRLSLTLQNLLKFKLYYK